MPTHQQQFTVRTPGRATVEITRKALDSREGGNDASTLGMGHALLQCSMTRNLKIVYFAR